MGRWPLLTIRSEFSTSYTYMLEIIAPESEDEGHPISTPDAEYLGVIPGDDVQFVHASIFVLSMTIPLHL